MLLNYYRPFCKLRITYLDIFLYAFITLGYNLLLWNIMLVAIFVLYRSATADVHPKQLSFFSFPKDVQRAKQWAAACGCDDLIDRVENLYRGYRVCSKHFENKMFLSDLHNRLQHHAVPVLLLDPITPHDVNTPVPTSSTNSKGLKDQFPLEITSPDEQCTASSFVTTTSRTICSSSSLHGSTQTPASFTSSSPRKINLRTTIKKDKKN